MRSRTIMEAELAFDKGLLESSQYRDPGFTKKQVPACVKQLHTWKGRRSISKAQ